MSWQGDDKKLDMKVDDRGHGFHWTNSYTILNFLWNALDYGELQDAGDDNLGSYTVFD